MSKYNATMYFDIHSLQTAINQLDDKVKIVSILRQAGMVGQGYQAPDQYMLIVEERNEF